MGCSSRDEGCRAAARCGRIGLKRRKVPNKTDDRTSLASTGVEQHLNIDGSVADALWLLEKFEMRIWWEQPTEGEGGR